MEKILIPIGIIAVLVIIYLVNRAMGLDESDSEDAVRIRSLKEAIAEHGIRADAVVKEIRRIRTRSTPSVSLTYIDMTLEGTLPDGTAFRVASNALSLLDTAFSFDAAFAGYVGKVGAVIPLIVHPTEHDAVLIDERRLTQLATAQ